MKYIILFLLFFSSNTFASIIVCSDFVGPTPRYSDAILKIKLINNNIIDIKLRSQYENFSYFQDKYNIIYIRHDDILQINISYSEEFIKASDIWVINLKKKTFKLHSVVIFSDLVKAIDFEYEGICHL